MQLKLPRPSRLFAAHPRSRQEDPAETDDPWAGEDAEWDAGEGNPEPPGEFLGFFRGVALAALAGLAAWVALGLVLLRLLQ